MTNLFTTAYILVLFSFNIVLSQSQFSWVEAGGGEFHDRGRAICSDLNGNVYITGIVDQNASFGQFSLNSEWEDIFIAKYDSSGSVLWAKKAGSSSPLEGGFGICVDHFGNSYITGTFKGTAYFDNDSITSYGDQDIFIAKYNSTGDVVWVRNAGGSLLDNANGIALDSLNNLYITGRITGDADFGTVSLIDANNGGADIFVSKYSTNGNCLWAKRAGGTNWDEGYEIDLDADGSIYTTGFFSNVVVFGTDTLISSGRCPFVVKYDNSGNVLWARQAHPYSYSEGTSIATYPGGGCAITGYFQSGIVFDSVDIVAYGDEDVYVARYDEDGNFIWAKHAGGIDRDRVFGVDVSSYGDIAITGRFESTAQFDSISMTSFGFQDIFVAKYNGDGNVIWALKAGSSTNTPLAYEETGYGITFDALDNCYATGVFKNSADFPPLSITSSNFADVFLTKINSNNLGENELNAHSLEFTVYPNPNNGSFVIDLENVNNLPLELSIFDLLGQNVDFEMNVLSNGAIKICSEDISSGMYIIEITQGTFNKDVRVIVN